MLKKAALICNTTFRAHRMFIGIEFPPRSPCSAGQPGSRGGVIQYSKSFPSKNKTDIAGVGRLGRDIHAAFRWWHYVYTTCSYDRFRMNAILVYRLRSWRIWIPRIGRYCPALRLFQNHSPLCLSIDKNVREEPRHRYKGGETVRGPAMLPDNSGIRDGEWSIGGWYGRLLS